MNVSAKLDRLVILFEKLIIILEHEGEHFYRQIFCGMKLMIDSAHSEEERIEVYKSISDTYKKMSSAKGGFSDFFIWRDDFDDRIKINKEPDNIRVEIWNLVN